MPNERYPSGAQAIGDGDIDWPAADIRVLLVDGTYTYDAGHDSLADIPSGSRLSVMTASLANKTNVDGLLDADDVNLPAAAIGEPNGVGLVIYLHTGVEATSTLLGWVDTQTDGSPIDITPDDNVIPIVWSADGVLNL